MNERLADDLLYGARQIAAFTGIPERAVYGYAEKGSFPAFKMGGTLCARKSEIERSLSAGSTSPPVKVRKSVTFSVSLEPNLADKIDEWRLAQTGAPTRAHAVRMLLTEALP